MTVVAYKDGIIACDSQISVGDSAWSNVKKIKRVKGWLIGAAGNLDMLTLFLQKFDPAFIEAHKNFPALSSQGKNEDFEGIVISPTSEIYYLETSGIVTKLNTEGFIAIGCGSTAAMACMAVGADAVTAVRTTMKYNKGCGGKLYKLELK